MVMVTVKTIDVTQNFSKIADLVEQNEKVNISRPHNKNMVILSEKRYNELEKAERNLACLAKLHESIKQAENGDVVMYTREQMRNMETE